MAETKKPWWKRVWPWLLAIGAAFLAGLGLMKGKALLAGKQAQDQQDKDNKVLDEKLKVIDEKKAAKLEAVEAKKDLAEEKAKNAHEERERAIERETDKRAAELAADPSRIPGSLVDTITRAERKLRD